MYLLKTIVLELRVIHVAMYTAGWKDGASGADFCASGLTVGSTGRAVSRDASTEDLIFSSDMVASSG
jgi:hypothetical protein